MSAQVSLHCGKNSCLEVGEGWEGGLELRVPSWPLVRVVHLRIVQHVVHCVPVVCDEFLAAVHKESGDTCCLILFCPSNKEK